MQRGKIETVTNKDGSKLIKFYVDRIEVNKKTTNDIRGNNQTKEQNY